MNKIYNSFAYTKYQFLRETQFKVNILFVLFGSIIASIIQYYLWTSVEVNSEIDTTEYMVYAIMVIVINLLIPITQVAFTISNMIVKGQIVIWLIRPSSLLETVFFKTLGKSLFLFVFQCIPLLISFKYLFNISIDVSIESGLMFVLSFVLGYIIAFLIGYIVGVLSVYFISINGFVALISGCMVIFGGSIIPIAIYPEWLQTLASYTPFYFVTYFPLSLITIEKMTYTPMILQFLWILLLGTMSLIASKKIFEKSNISGG